MEDPYQRIQSEVDKSVATTNRPSIIIGWFLVGLCAVSTIVFVITFGVWNYQKSVIAKAVQIDPGITSTKILVMPTVWSSPSVVPNGTPWTQTLPQDGVVHFFIRVHHRFGSWSGPLGSYTRATISNAKLGDNIDMVEFMSAERVPIDITFIVQKPPSSLQN